ncbi:hypothetical protein BCEN4_120031 [Burkholderia cenocepacia]|nr:hypothetical protein BCEN4_120031 [Burkholderia cenocepacia]
MRVRRRHDRDRHVRPRRHAGRARALVQDDVLRRRLPRAADRACAGPLRRRAGARARVARRPAADARRAGRRGAGRRMAGPRRRREPGAAPARHARARCRARRIPRGRRACARRDDPARRLEIRALPGRSRPALQPVGRPARADEPGRAAGSRRRARRVPRAGRAALEPARAGPAGAREPAAPALPLRGDDAGPHPGVGLAAVHRREPALHAQSHRTRHARGDGAFSARRALSVRQCEHSRTTEEADDETAMQCSNPKDRRGARRRRVRGGDAAGACRRSADVRRREDGGARLDRHRRDECDGRRRAEGARLPAGRGEPVGADHVPGVEERAGRRVPRQLDARAGAAREAVRRRKIDRRAAREPERCEIHARGARLRGRGRRAHVRRSRALRGPFRRQDLRDRARRAREPEHQADAVRPRAGAHELVARRIERDGHAHAGRARGARQALDRVSRVGAASDEHEVSSDVSVGRRCVLRPELRRRDGQHGHACRVRRPVHEPRAAVPADDVLRRRREPDDRRHARQQDLARARGATCAEGRAGAGRRLARRRDDGGRRTGPAGRARGPRRPLIPSLRAAGVYRAACLRVFPISRMATI